MISKEKVEKIVEEYPYYFTSKIKEEYSDFYKGLDDQYIGDTFSEKIYKFLYGRDSQYCDMPDCDGKTEFKNMNVGYKKYCSRSCAARKVEPKEVRICEFCESEFEVYKSSEKKYCCHECYVEHRLEKEDFDEQLEKARKICREKYGSMGFGQDDIEESIRKTMNEKYDDRYFNNREKMKKTKESKYGDPYYNNKEKTKSTKKERYGDPYYSNRKKASKTRKENKYRELLEKSEFSERVEPLFDSEEYNGAEGYAEYPFRCKDCNEEFEDYLYSGNVPRCPNCYDGWNYVGSSEKEKEVAKYVESVVSDNLTVIRNDKSVLDGKELDVYIPEKNLAIEFDGHYWHSERLGGKDRYYHVNKTDLCEEQGIQLIHIFETEWAKKRDIVKSRLRHILGCSNKDSIYARKCSVKEIPRERKTEFLEGCHIQGAGRSSVKLGLFYGEFFNSDLVAVMTFGTPSLAQGHKESKEGFWEMKRYALSDPVVGGAGKLFKHFIRNYNVDRVKTYADRRWSTKINNVYEKIGFEYDGASNPNYFYFHEDDHLNLQHRFGFRKNVLDEKLDEFNPDLTEWQNMQRNGYDRIWDCGHLKYVWESE